MDPQVSPTLTPEPTPSPVTPEPQPAPVPNLVDEALAEAKPKRRKLWLWGAATLLLIVAAGGGYYFWSQQKKAAPVSNAKTESIISAQDYRFVPRFTRIGAYIKFQDAEWYAAPAALIKISNAGPKYYSQHDGLPAGNLTSLAVHNGVLWVGSQNGTAMLKPDGSAFTEVPIAGKTSVDDVVQNGKIFHDAAASKLYLSTYTDFFQYNDTTKAWQSVVSTKPVNANAMVVNDKFAIATTSVPGAPVWVLDKSTGRWNPRPISGFSSDSASVFEIGGELFTMGRPNGFSSCSDTGKVAATVAYHLDAAGSWQPMTAFNSDKARSELSPGVHLKSTTATAYTSTCAGNETAKIFDMKFADGALSLANERTAPAGIGGVRGDDGELQTVVDEVSKATGLYPFTRALAVDRANDVIFSYSKKAEYSTADDGLAIANGSDFAHSKIVELAGFKRGDTVRPILCDGQMKYAFVGTPSTGEGGPKFTWDSAKLLAVNGVKTTQVADLTNDVASPVFACSDQKISWLGMSGVKQFDLKSKKIEAVGEAVGANLTTLSGQSYALDNGDLWLVAITGDGSETAIGTIYYFDHEGASLTKVGPTGKNPTIEAASSENIWISGPLDGPKTTLTMYDKQGVTAYAKPYSTPLKLAATGKATATMMSGATSADVFRPVMFTRLDSSGGTTAVSADNIAVRVAYNAGSYETSLSLYDASRGRLWITDTNAGLFSVPQ